MSEHKAKVQGTRMEIWNRGLGDLVNEFSKEYQRDILVKNSGGRANRPYCGTRLVVAFYSYPNIDTEDHFDVECLKNVNNVDFRRPTTTFKGDGGGVSIRDINGTKLAEHIESTLYIFPELLFSRFELNDEDIADRLNIINYILEAYFIQTTKSMEEYEEWVAGKRSEILAKVRSDYVKLCELRSEVGLSIIDGEISSLNRDLEDLRKEFLSLARRRLDLIEEKDKKQKELENEELDNYEDEYNKLTSLKFLQSVCVNLGEEYPLSVITEPIFIESSGYDAKAYRFSLGRFKINIRPYRSVGSDREFDLSKIRIVSVDAPVSGKVHPHVNSNGNCCFGNIMGSIVSLWKENQFMVLIQVMVQFLQSYSPSTGPFHHIADWPGELIEEESDG